MLYLNLLNEIYYYIHVVTEVTFQIDSIFKFVQIIKLKFIFFHFL